MTRLDFFGRSGSRPDSERATRVPLRLPSRIAFLGTAMLTGAFAALSVQASTEARPAADRSLPPMVAASMSSAIGRDDGAYHATASKGDLRLRNEAHDLDAALTESRLDVRSGGRRFGLALRSYGRSGAAHAIAPTKPTVSRNRVEYRRDGLVEWYENGPMGLEQGFTLATRPDGASGAPLVLAFELDGDLEATLDADARGLTLSRPGSAVLQYSGLTALDRDGDAIPARLELDGRRMRIRVEDAGADYPLTIDPVLGAVRLTNNKALCSIGGICDFGNAGDRFGFGVAISSDGATVAVSAPHATGSNVNSGAVYVFRRPSFGGWNGCITINCLDYVAKLQPSTTQASWGTSVAMSGDGTTIVVLGDTLGTPDSSAGVMWLFQKPTNGWVSTSAQNAILSVTSVTEVPCGFSGNAADCNTDFTSSLDVSGDGSTVVFGYSGGLVGGLSRGAVYVYARPLGGWVNSAAPAKLTRSNGAHLDLLGQAVAISDDGNTIVAAAPQANGVLGAALVFLKGGSAWTNQTQAAELTYGPNDGLLFLGNGVDVDASGSTVVVGGNGRALIFGQTRTQICTKTGICAVFNAWLDAHEKAILSTTDGSPIAWPRLSGDGSRVVASGFESPGMVYAYLRPDTGWASATQGARFGAAAGQPGDLLGHTSNPGTPAIALSSDGSTLLAGAPGTTIGSNAGQGAAYLFLPEPAGAASLFVGALTIAGLGARGRRGISSFDAREG